MTATYTFHPPTILAIPPISVADRKHAPDTQIVNKSGYRLMRWYPMRARGVNVWVILVDGLFQQIWMSDPVPGIGGDVVIGWPYPDAIPNINGAKPFPGQDNPVNNAISSSWFSGGVGGVGGSGPGGSQQYAPEILYEYLGSHPHVVTAAEQVILISNGIPSSYFTPIP